MDRSGLDLAFACSWPSPGIVKETRCFRRCGASGDNGLRFHPGVLVCVSFVSPVSPLSEPSAAGAQTGGQLRSATGSPSSPGRPVLSLGARVLAKRGGGQVFYASLPALRCLPCRWVLLALRVAPRASQLLLTPSGLVFAIGRVSDELLRPPRSHPPPIEERCGRLLSRGLPEDRSRSLPRNVPDRPSAGDESQQILQRGFCSRSAYESGVSTRAEVWLSLMHNVYRPPARGYWWEM